MKRFDKIYRPQKYLPVHSIKTATISTHKGYKKKAHLLNEIQAAKDFYEKEYKSWKRLNQKRALASIKFYDYLALWYKDTTLSEIAFRMKLSVSAVATGLKQCEQRVDIYTKLKEKGLA